MSFLLLNFAVGLVAGAFLRVQTLIVLALLVFFDVVWERGTSGIPSVALWSFAAESMLQLGYLAGVFVRDSFQRSDRAFRFTKGFSGPSPR